MLNHQIKLLFESNKIHSQFSTSAAFILLGIYFIEFTKEGYADWLG